MIPSSRWKDCPVAITGATGFVGHHLAMLLANLGARVVALVRASSARERLLQARVRCVVAPLDDSPALTAACHKCEVLFHVAGVVDFRNDWQRFQEGNVQGTLNVLTAARQAGVRRVVHTSSIVAVGATERPTVQDENSPWNLEEFAIPYVTTKRRAEEIALASSDSTLEVVVVNPSSVVGPDDFTASEFGTLCKRFWRGRIPFYFGGGNNFVDVRDVALGHLLAAERGQAGQRYILGGINLTYGEFFGELARAARRRIFRLRLPTALAPMIAWLEENLTTGKGGRAYLTSAQARLMRRFFFASSQRAREELGYEPRPLGDSLQDAHAFWIGKKSA